MPERSRFGVSDVKHLSWLTRIDLTDKEAREIARQLARILAYFRKIDEVDTSGVEPIYHPLEIANVSRSDEPAPFPPDEILKIVPSRKGRYVKAPRMV